MNFQDQISAVAMTMELCWLHALQIALSADLALKRMYIRTFIPPS